MSKPIDITNQRFGSLVAISLVERTNQGAVWECMCDCGNTTRVHAKTLRYGSVKSCGCGMGKSHGMSYTKTYRAWRSMQDRCYNTNRPNYGGYGGRGITVCDEWRSSFENFYRDMGECPDGLSLDRINVNGNYCKENCRWATQSVQVFNTRISKYNTSGKSGVDFHKKARKWRAIISLEGKTIHLGLFDLFDDAVSAREEAELKYFGFIKE